jgi:phosphoenolpyruvate phosphomutase
MGHSAMKAMTMFKKLPQQEVGSEAARLRKLLTRPRLAQVAGVSDGLSALLAETHGFDALWASGFAISTAHGVPDASILTMTECLSAANVINGVSRLPVVADCDTGFGDVGAVVRMTREYERAGIAAICIEDKEFPKRNSFADSQRLLPIEEFSAKVRAAKYAQSDPDFVVVARIEALVAGLSLGDALERADAYRDAGADSLLIHSRSPEPNEVFGFAEEWHRRSSLPLIAVPTTYSGVSRARLEDAGFAMVIYANQGMRAAWGAINKTFRNIRQSDTLLLVEDELPDVSEILEFSGIKDLEEFTELLKSASRNGARQSLRAQGAPDSQS